MTYTVLVNPGCSRCDAVVAALEARGAMPEVLTPEGLMELPALRRAELWAKVMASSSRDYPFVFEGDELANVDELTLEGV